jgi:hypothetical protein
MSLSKSASEVERLHVVVGALGPAFSSILPVAKRLRRVTSATFSGVELRKSRWPADAQEDFERLAGTEPGDSASSHLTRSARALPATSSPSPPSKATSVLVVVIALKVAPLPPSLSAISSSSSASAAARAAKDVEALDQVREVDLERDVRRRRRRQHIVLVGPLAAVEAAVVEAGRARIESVGRERVAGDVGSA